VSGNISIIVWITVSADSGFILNSAVTITVISNSYIKLTQSCSRISDIQSIPSFARAVNFKFLNDALELVSEASERVD
jgi:hypothetical protein